MNGGGIRGGKIYPAGLDLTRRDILSELPFGNRLVITSSNIGSIRTDGGGRIVLK
jgi:5'-nucleotidase / UDP-sugar diphosphatase